MRLTTWYYTRHYADFYKETNTCTHTPPMKYIETYFYVHNLTSQTFPIQNKILPPPPSTFLFSMNGCSFLPWPQSNLAVNYDPSLSLSNSQETLVIPFKALSFPTASPSAAFVQASIILAQKITCFSVRLLVPCLFLPSKSSQSSSDSDKVTLALTF